MKQGNTYQEMIKPLLVLVIICLAVSALLGFTNSVTEPIIEENKRIAAEETRRAVLDGAESFTELDCDTEALGITGAYREDSGKGYVISAQRKGYGGMVTVTVGLNAEGEIVGLDADVSTETSGVGSKAGTPEYIGRFLGLRGDSGSVDKISGATYSSTAVKSGVDAALAAFAVLVGEGA